MLPDDSYITACIFYLVKLFKYHGIYNTNALYKEYPEIRQLIILVSLLMLGIMLFNWIIRWAGIRARNIAIDNLKIESKDSEKKEEEDSVS